MHETTEPAALADVPSTGWLGADDEQAHAQEMIEDLIEQELERLEKYDRNEP